MAANIDLAASEIIQLTRLTAADLDPLLEEEIGVWHTRFAWDFRPSADLLRRFLAAGSLEGCALRTSEGVIGYSYYVCEARKGLIGDFFVRREYATPENELTLLAGVVERLTKVSGVRRIESQLMQLETPAEGTVLPLSGRAQRYERMFMEVEPTALTAMAPVALGCRVEIFPWAERYMEEMAHLLANCYRGHVDSEINDQYRSIPGARQFLINIIRFPGCGTFVPEASLLALDASTGRLCGMCLASCISGNAGHITQVCVLPPLRGLQLGHELIRQTMGRLVERGCETVSLTVTCSNVGAVSLYESLGFETTATFPALIWDGL